MFAVILTLFMLTHVFAIFGCFPSENQLYLRMLKYTLRVRPYLVEMKPPYTTQVNEIVFAVILTLFMLTHVFHHGQS